MSSVPNPPLKLLPQQKSREDPKASVPQEAEVTREPQSFYPTGSKNTGNGRQGLQNSQAQIYKQP